jgi:hypothetical protein
VTGSIHIAASHNRSAVLCALNAAVTCLPSSCIAERGRIHIRTRLGADGLLEAVSSLRSNQKFHKTYNCSLQEIIPCGGGLEYLHRSPASRRRRRKGNSVSNETEKFGLKFCLDLDLTVSTARYRAILSSERTPYITIQVNVRVKEH